MNGSSNEPHAELQHHRFLTIHKIITDYLQSHQRTDSVRTQPKYIRYRESRWASMSLDILFILWIMYSYGHSASKLGTTVLTIYSYLETDLCLLNHTSYMPTHCSRPGRRNQFKGHSDTKTLRHGRLEWKSSHVGQVNGSPAPSQLISPY